MLTWQDLLCLHPRGCVRQQCSAEHGVARAAGELARALVGVWKEAGRALLWARPDSALHPAAPAPSLQVTLTDILRKVSA